MIPGSLKSPVPAAKWFFALYLIAGVCWLAGSAAAEEGGSGHYLPGSMSSFVDGVPLKETFIVRANVVNYNGSISAKKPIPIGGRTTLGADATSWAYGLSLLWRPPLEIGKDWSYAMSATIPYVVMDVSADVEATAGNVSSAVSRSSTTNGLGDIVLMPLMLNYNVHPDFNVNFRLGIYAPTGDYKVGRLSNTGKNFWSIEPVLGLMYFGQKNGFEASAFFGADVQHRKRGHGLSVGYTGLHRRHVGTTFPAVRRPRGRRRVRVLLQAGDGRQRGRGDVRRFQGQDGRHRARRLVRHKILDHDTIFELKWLHEVETENRLEGDIVWFKVVYKF